MPIDLSSLLEFGLLESFFNRLGVMQVAKDWYRVEGHHGPLNISVQRE